MISNEINESFLLNYNKLQIGDIILESGHKTHSELIKLATNSDFSHAMICIEFPSLFHATTKGIFTLNPQRLLVKNKTDLKVLRFKQGLSDEQRRQIVIFLRNKVGSLYSISVAVSVKIHNEKHVHSISRTQFCSRLVAQAYAHIGYNIVANPDYCSPEEINQSNFFEEIQDMVCKASQEEIAFTKTRDFVKENMTSTYKWLKEARKIASKYQIEIYTQNDVQDFLLSYPSEDKKVCDYIEKSGYLENYLIDMKNNPYLYDKKKFIQKFPENEILYAIQEVFKKEPGLIQRYLDNYFIAKQNYQKTPLRFFSLQVELYQNILSAVMSRILTLIDVYNEFILKFNSSTAPLFMQLMTEQARLKTQGIEPHKKNKVIDKLLLSSL